MKLLERFGISPGARLIESGPPMFSTSLDMQPFPPVIWDANGYYRELGVHPRASRKEIIEAYKASDGMRSERLTFIFKQLLDPGTRRRYDATPLAHIFVDEYVLAGLRRHSARQASEDIRSGRITFEEASASMAQPASEEGYGEASDRPLETVDLVDPEMENQELSHPADTFSYGYYLWNVGVADEEKLARWQALLCLAIGRRKEDVEIAIGLHSFDEPVHISRVGYRTVVFLHHGAQPDEALAEVTASILLQKA